MKRVLMYHTALLVAGLTVSPAVALAGLPPLNSSLQLINDTDDAIEVSASGLDIQVTHVLEPHSGVSEVILNAPIDILVTASLVSDPSVSAQRTVKAKEQTRTTVRVQSRVRRGVISLSMSIDTYSGGGGKGKGKGHVAKWSGSQESDVALASTGGLGCLLLLGMLLGRSPRRRELLIAGEPVGRQPSDGHSPDGALNSARLRTLAVVLSIMALMTSPTMAGTTGRGPQHGFVKVTNTCDEAVMVAVSSPAEVLEPGSSRTFVIPMDRGNTQASINAALVATPSVNASATCKVAKNKTTSATVSCSTTAGGVTLSIDVGTPQKLTSHQPSHETDVMLASTGGLGGLLLLGTLLGRSPRRRRQVPTADDSSAIRN